jgi:hypothetical protein
MIFCARSRSRLRNCPIARLFANANARRTNGRGNIRAVPNSKGFQYGAVFASIPTPTLGGAYANIIESIAQNNVLVHDAGGAPGADAWCGDGNPVLV